MRKLLIISLLLSAVVLSCGSQNSESAMDATAKMSYDEAAMTAPEMEEQVLALAPSEADYATKPASEEPKDDAVKIEQQLIKTGNVSLEVDDFKASRAHLMQLLKESGAYVSSDNEENSSYRVGSNFVIRVPKASFDTLVERVCALGSRVESKSISLQDVTEEFVDIQARLKTKREVEARYTDILKSARTVEDILRVEEHLRLLREEIEAKEGRLKYLRNQVSLSTLNLSMYQQHSSPTYSESFWSKLADGFMGGWSGFQSFLVGLTYMWPFLLIFAGLGWWTRRWWRARKQKVK